MTEHLFGGPWTQLKLDIVDKYLAAWLTAMNRQRFTKVYIDAFAGSGRVRLRVGGQQISGSAERALHNHAFDRYVFIDKNARRVRQLEALADEHGKSNRTMVHCGEANTFLQQSLRQYARRNTRGVVFLDPYGLQLAWASLASIAQTGTMDVWYLFPLSGFYRQAARQADRLDADKEAALDRILGPCDWRTELYSASAQADLFQVAPDERNSGPVALQRYAKGRLETIFPAVAEPKILRGPNNAPLYSLFFCVSNPSGAAQGIAMRIAKHLLER